MNSAEQIKQILLETGGGFVKIKREIFDKMPKEEQNKLVYHKYFSDFVVIKGLKEDPRYRGPKKSADRPKSKRRDDKKA